MDESSGTSSSLRELHEALVVKRAAPIVSLVLHPMNNTKWREIWLVLAEMRLRIHFAYVGDDGWNAANSGTLQGPFSVSQVAAHGVRDPGIGGPFQYTQILWIRVPRAPGTDVEAFVGRVRSLGLVPLHVGPDYVEIRGY